ncbi:MAG: bifunctional phosphoglucose/phosphomannose isomerase [Caldisericia bacterium]|nr:bifunctional phosphoglucose/phosphomannose isomerase [Caldisericia bacterium]
MFDLFFKFPLDFKLSRSLTLEKKIDFNLIKDVENIVISGMGGSGFTGDFIYYLFKDYIKIPIIINKDYKLPKFISNKTLLFLISYSGNTEETLSNFYEGEKKGAKIISITSNGELFELSEKRYLTYKIPSSYPPRMAFPYLFYPVYFILKLFLEEDLGEDEFFDKINSLYEKFKENDNEGDRISDLIKEKIPIIYSSNSLTPVALRWKQEINENSKYISYNLSFPELNHNESVFWDCKEFKDKLIFIILRDQLDISQMKKRIDISVELLKKRGWNVLEFLSFGEKPLFNLYSLIPLGDYISIKLALLKGIEPLPVKIIDELKRKLKE